AYVCHDFEDAVAAGIVGTEMLPDAVAARCGVSRSGQLGTFIRAMVRAAAESGRIGMTEPEAEALAEFRRFDYDHVYLRPASRQQASAVIELLRALVEHYADRPQLLPEPPAASGGSDEAMRAAVSYVAGMTDRYACRQAVALLGWDPAKLPAGVS
ncbi:MAG: HD domain-containing protein, partial [Ilumatobacteraceae bacterium]